MLRDDLLGEALHLFHLRTELQKRDRDTDVLELIETFRNLLCASDESRAQTAIGDRVIFERHFLLQSRSGEPLLVVREPSRARVHVRDPRDLAPHLGVRLTADHETGDTEDQWRLPGR